MKNILKQFLRHDTHPALQFLKYAIAGGIATATHMTIFFFLTWKVFPALQADDQAVQIVDWIRMHILGLDTGMTVYPFEEALRARHFVINTSIAFVFSNLVCYVINILWVFEPGRHERHVEIILFFVVSIVSMVVGTSLGWGLIHFFGFSTTTSFLGQLFASLMINYVCRKYFVFKG